MHDEIKEDSDFTAKDSPGIEEISLTRLSDDPVIMAMDTGMDDLRRWGFQQAIRDAGTPDIKAADLVILYQQKLTDQLERWKSIYQQIQDRYNEKIARLRDEVEQLKLAGNGADPTKEELQLRKETVLGEMKELRKRILDVRRRMVTGKEDMMNKWMEEAEKQMDKAVQLQKKVYAETRFINKQRYDDEKTTLDKHITHWTAKRGKLQERQEQVHQQMKQLGADGINPNNAYVLLGIGTSVAAAAGYFFSIFTSTANFGNQDAFFFLLNGLLTTGASPQTGLLTKAGLLVGFVLLIGVISWGCYKLIKYFFDKKGNSREEVFRTQYRARMLRDNTDSSTELKAGSWFSLWLQIAPAVIIIGIVILLLALNSSGISGASRLNSSIEGVLAGTAVALGVGGVMCLYIMKIVEPRLMRKRQEERGVINWLKYNWELAACILLFILCTLSIVMYNLNGGTLGGQETIAVAIPEFIVVAMLSAFPFAYGIRFRGLLAVNRFLQREIDRLDISIAECSTPEIPEITVNYSVKMQEIVEDVLAVVQNKAMLLRGVSSVEDLRPKKTEGEKKSALFTNILDYLKKLRDRYSATSVGEISPIQHLTRLADWERRYFPDLDEEIKLLAFEYREYEQEFKDISNQLDKLAAETVTGDEKREQEIKKLLQHIETILSWAKNSETDKLKRYANMELLSIRAETAILDGYNLGIWYRVNGLGPVDNYYTNDIKPLFPDPVNNNHQDKEETLTTKLLDNGNS
ncbi:SPX domain-containing protein [Ferruginibacter profundus]